MLTPNRWLPPLMEQLAIRQNHGPVLFAGHFPECSRAEVAECSKTLVAMRGHAPASLSYAISQICFIPFDRAKCFVQGTDLFDACAPHDPWTNDNVDLGETQPIQGCVSNRWHHVLETMKVLPPHDGSL